MNMRVHRSRARTLATPPEGLLGRSYSRSLDRNQRKALTARRSRPTSKREGADMDSIEYDTFMTARATQAA